jgi:hypothetical protein
VGCGVDVGFTQESCECWEQRLAYGTIKVDLRNTTHYESLARGSPMKEALRRSTSGRRPVIWRITPGRGLSTYMMETALDPLWRPVDQNPRRCGVIRTARWNAGQLFRCFRYHIITVQGDKEKPPLAEDCQPLAFTGSPQNAEWLSSTASV